LFFIYSCSENISPVDSGLEDKIFHFGNGTEPQGIDPHIVTGVPEHHLLIGLCEGLTTANPKGGSSIAGAAESWDISEDGKTYTFYLQKNGRWSNGDKVTAQDFVWSWKRLLTPSLGAQYPDMLYYVVNAEKYYVTQDLPNVISSLLVFIIEDEELSNYHNAASSYFESESLKDGSYVLLNNSNLKNILELFENVHSDFELRKVITIDDNDEEFIKPKNELIKNITKWNITKLFNDINFDDVGVKAINNNTLQVKLSNPTPFFAGLLSHYSTWPVHKETVMTHGSIDDRNGEWTRPGNFVCNGAFNLKSWELNKKIVVEKNPMYWDASTVKLNEIHYYPVSVVMTEDRMFRSGQLHVTSTLPSQKCPVYIEEQNPNLRIDPYMGTYFYRFNTNNPALSDPKVRKALAYSINRKQIVEKVTKCGQIPAYSFTPPGSNGYEPDTEIPFDPELGMKLLKEAGYDENNPFPKLEILFNTNEDHKKVALAIQNMWQQNLGIDVELVNTDWKVYLSREMIGDFQVSRAGWIGDYEDPNTFLDLMRPNRGNNKTGWENPEYDRLVQLANTKNNQNERYELLKQAERILIDEMPIIPLYTYVRVYQLSGDVKGYYPNYLDHHHPKYFYLERD
jgi:oligopeptide transport system substrate-binding protein